MNTTSSRRSHRKRISLRLSTDTTSTLPEYISAGWQRSEDDPPSDRPPDYPDSAEEADEDTDSEGNSAAVYVPPLSPRPTSPRRVRRFPTHRRRQSGSTSTPTDQYLDSLLERSVHALEMSNTLLQSSISTQTSLSAVLGSDSPADNTLEARARGLSSRIRENRGMHENWADDLIEISEGVEGLFGDEGRRRSSSYPAHSAESSLSSSLPNSSSPSRHRQHRRRPSLDLRHTPNSDMPQLHLSPQDRSHLVAPPPRALTQYIASTSDPNSITLPSTLGLRSPSSSHISSDWRPLTEAVSSSNYHASVSLPIVTDRPLEPSTPAYNMLSSFVHRSPSSGSSTPATLTSLISRRRGSSNGSPNIERASLHSPSPSSHIAHKSPDRTRTAGSGALSSRSQTPIRSTSPHSVPHRCMTPPIEESSSSSSDGCPAKLTVVSLRKILDDQPIMVNGDSQTPGSSLSSTALPERHRPPAFLPRSPAPVAEASTSTATASISRLFTKATHSSSTRPPSPPRHSSMKQLSSSNSSTPRRSPSPTALSIPDIFGVGVAMSLGSGQSSGRSTPKRISFAKLPESYASSRPQGSSSKFKDKQNRRRGKHRKSGSADEMDVDGKRTTNEGGRWWNRWLLGASEPLGVYGVGIRHEERMEDRMSRSWGGRMSPGFGVDGWAV